MSNSSNINSDLRLVGKIFAILDSPEEGEATAAVIRLRAILRKCDMPLYAAVETHAFKTAIWEAMGHPKCLHGYFEADRIRDAYAKLEAESNELAAAVMGLRKDKKLCPSCEKKRRGIAVVLGLVLIKAWSLKFPPAEVSMRMTMSGALLGFVPYLAVVCRWRVVNFMWDLDWVSMTDNKLYRAIAARWNRFLGRMALS
jgi:hypothetical protein